MPGCSVSKVYEAKNSGKKIVFYKNIVLHILLGNESEVGAVDVIVASINACIKTENRVARFI